jgi:hypothetical protein
VRPAPAPVCNAKTASTERIEASALRLSRPKPEPKDLGPIAKTRKLTDDEQERSALRLTRQPRPASAAARPAPKKVEPKLSADEVRASADRLSTVPPKEVASLRATSATKVRKLTPEEQTASAARLVKVPEAPALETTAPKRRSEGDWASTVDRLHPEPPGMLSSGVMPKRQ